MAFVIKTEKASFIQDKESALGPGYYDLPIGNNKGLGYAPFLSAAPKVSIPKKPMVAPGPGSYNIPSGFEKTQKYQKVCYATLSSQSALSESAHMSHNFKSKVQRFDNNDRSKSPGPGKYYKALDMVKRKHSVNVGQSHLNPIIEKTIEQNRKGIPSIPGTVNSYGYTQVSSMIEKIICS